MEILIEKKTEFTFTTRHCSKNQYMMVWNICKSPLWTLYLNSTSYELSHHSLYYKCDPLFYTKLLLLTHSLTNFLFFHYFICLSIDLSIPLLSIVAVKMIKQKFDFHDSKLFWLMVNVFGNCWTIGGRVWMPVYSQYANIIYPRLSLISILKRNYLS